jgi:5-formyltetrahydrofolate cyclo-ligase
MGLNVAEAKQSLRREILAKRTSVENQADMFSQKLLDLIAGLEAKSVGCYISFGTEPGTAPFIDRAKSTGLVIACPKMLEDGSMIFVEHTEKTQTSKLGFIEPTGRQISNLDVLVMPALAVDASGQRLGRGAGYFDRYLEIHSAKTVALVYDWEFVESLPTESHDKAVDYLITPARTLDFSKTR